MRFRQLLRLDPLSSAPLGRNAFSEVWEVSLTFPLVLADPPLFLPSLVVWGKWHKKYVIYFLCLCKELSRSLLPQGSIMSVGDAKMADFSVDSKSSITTFK